ncbi:Type III restriction enzyme, res subunit [Belliella baltica DSM 15883]|uniref:DNA helicase n=1 Tax=Belliella baltica (strain DSM 15883 / CIP 108006 / LMG 21964 / BA134) TaxID=866536 RepID=I3ZAC3_BELBD|nr:AAA domain-containing protein [Belliella baltica]AFL86191.1 Type III restriction enzyme, res subunit [Belliella baltica DSM 15883]
MPNIQEELKTSLKLLQLEWKEDLEQYKKKFLYTSISDKKEQGVCWYPLQIKKSKIGLGDRLILELERFDSNQSHVFQSGKSVSLFSNADGFQGHEFRMNGVINFVKKDVMTLTLQSNDFPDWLYSGKIGVDLLFDEASYREMESTMKAVIKADKGRLGELKSILLGETLPSFSQKVYHDLQELNPAQNQALRLINQSDDVAIIHGPPGTGKTTTLIAAIQNILKTNRQVLVCAPSNAAVDLLVEKLVDKGVPTLRIGHPARVDDKILAQTLDAKIASHESYKDLKKLRKSVDEYRKLGRKYKRNFGHEERVQRKRLLDEAGRMKEDADILENYIMYDVFQMTQVFASTLVGSSNQALKGIDFPYVFIDEAGQGLEAATWIPIMKAEKVVMTGDHLQLPPTIKSYEAAKAGLSETLFEKVIKRQPEASKMLTVQYRMPEKIMGFSSKLFYKNNLEAAVNTHIHFLTEEESVLEFIDTAGSGFSEHQEKESLSTLNAEEAKFTLKYLENLLKRVGIGKIKTEGWNIGLISPYRAQVRKFQELIFESYEYPNLRSFSELLTIDSIDGFQGQERDIIFISLVRSNANGEIGFLSDTRRMNVALTRAKRKLVVIGDSSTLSSNDFYNAFLNYVEEKGEYKSIYEFLEY